jgi:DNA-directed RNA polymerase alpha subunit
MSDLIVRDADTIDALELSTRAANALKRNGVVCISDLVQKSEWDLLNMWTLGSRSLNEIKRALARNDLHLRPKAGRGVVIACSYEVIDPAATGYSLFGDER